MFLKIIIKFSTEFQNVAILGLEKIVHCNLLGVRMLVHLVSAWIDDRISLSNVDVKQILSIVSQIICIRAFSKSSNQPASEFESAEIFVVAGAS